MTISRRAALVFVLALCSAPARPDLLLPDARDAARPALLRRVWESVPPRLRPVGDVRVRAISDTEMDRRAREDDSNDDSVVDGISLRDGEAGPTILLRGSLPDGKMAHVFAHEIGHLVWDARLSRRDKHRYESAYRRARRAGHLVTEYAGESVEEGFAESLAFFLQEPDILRHDDPDSYAVLQELSAEDR